MNHVRAWLLGCVLTLLSTPALAGLQLELQVSGLDPQQQQASQALLDEAMGKLPPASSNSWIDASGQLERAYAYRRLWTGLAGRDA